MYFGLFSVNCILFFIFQNWQSYFQFWRFLFLKISITKTTHLFKFWDLIQEILIHELKTEVKTEYFSDWFSKNLCQPCSIPRDRYNDDVTHNYSAKSVNQEGTPWLFGVIMTTFKCSWRQNRPQTAQTAAAPILSLRKQAKKEKKFFPSGCGACMVSCHICNELQQQFLETKDFFPLIKRSCVKWCVTMRTLYLKEKKLAKKNSWVATKYIAKRGLSLALPFNAPKMSNTQTQFRVRYLEWHKHTHS